MKKLTILALSALFAVGAQAQDLFKQAKKIKDAAELQQFINANPTMSDQEKAQCYELLTRFYADKVADIQKVVDANQENKLMKKAETPYDTLTLYQSAYSALEAGVLCDKYDQLPNLKGKIKPQFRKDLSSKLYPMRNFILNGGIYFNEKGDAENVFKFFSCFIDSKDYPLFSELDSSLEPLRQGLDKTIPQIAYYAGAYAAQLDKGEAAVNKYCDIAASDPTYAKEAQTVKTSYAAKGLKTHEDSLAYAAKLEAMYEQDPSNIQTFQSLAMVLLGLNEAEKFDATCQKRIDSMPNDHVAYYFRGQIHCMIRDFEKALPDLEKANELKPGDAGINAFLGQCWVGMADMAESKAAGQSGIIPREAMAGIKPLWEKAVSFLEKAKSLDADGSNERNYKAKLSQAKYRLENDYKGV